jgi:4-amino-4-deoxy-L-arabinose transferase-like glycosyltransferase
MRHTSERADHPLKRPNDMIAITMSSIVATADAKDASIRRPVFYGPLSLVVLLLCMIAAHLGVLRVPYFWDETYFAPASHDLLLSGSLIPSSVAIESHPPLVYIWIALWWKLFGISIPIARIAMLAIAALTLAGVYRLARLVTIGAVPIVATALTAVYSVFFTESTMLQLDMAAAGLTLWGLVAYLQERRWGCGVLFSLAALAKETAIVAPAAILALELLLAIRDRKDSIGAAIRSVVRAAFPLLLPLLPLLCWFAWLYHSSGYVFGDADYVGYNLQSPLHPVRMLLACFQHLWHLLVYLNLFVLTGLAAIICATRPGLPAPSAPGQNSRAWLTIAAVIAGYVVMLSIVGAVVLARYLLPVYPLVVLACVAAISTRVKWWPAVALLTAIAFVAGLFPYMNRYLFRRDDNLAYLDYVALHQAAGELFANGPKVKVLTVWPSISELSWPWLGYTKHPMETLLTLSFTRQDLIAAEQKHPEYILMFPRRVCKTENPLLRANWWHQDFYRGAEELTPHEAAALMHARVIYYAQRHCDWVAVLKVAGADTAVQGQPVE